MLGNAPPSAAVPPIAPEVIYERRVSDAAHAAAVAQPAVKVSMLVDTAGGTSQSTEAERRRKEQVAADGLLAAQMQGRERRREVEDPAAVFNAKVGEMGGTENLPPHLPVNGGVALAPGKRHQQEKIDNRIKKAEELKMERNQKDLEALRLKNQQQ